uniref:Uncharacterized protein n=1 Tax=Lygus hesperus TaxID=30085 RepID=A0A0A9Z127_LYGHE
MLTVYYLAATWVQSWRLNSLMQKLRSVTDKHGSLAIHQELPPYLFSIGSSLKQKLEVNGVLSDQCMNYKSGHIVDFFWYQANKKAVSVFPKQILDVSGWILVLERKTHLPIQFTDCKTSQISKEDAIYVLVEANYLTCTFDYRGNTIELDKYGTPLAWHASDRLSLLIETNERNLSQLLLNFMQNEVTLENGIQILRILTVEPLGSPYKIGNEHTVPETYAKLNERYSGLN